MTDRGITQRELGDCRDGGGGGAAGRGGGAPPPHKGRDYSVVITTGIFGTSEFNCYQYGSTP
jgi:hypothetical protein